MLMCVCGLSPLAVKVAEVLVDGGFQIKEVLLHCSPDGSLNYPGNTHTKKYMFFVLFFYCV